MELTIADFQVMSTIGAGSFGTCKKVQRKKDGRILVCKEISYYDMDGAEIQELIQEVNIMRELHHPNIVQYHDSIIDSSSLIMYILMDYCHGGDLRRIIQQNRKDRTHVPEVFAWKILTQTAMALKECHQQKNGKTILHRDLKPDNVFLDAESNIKLGDFGLATVLRHQDKLPRTYAGTPIYMSPEIISGKPYDEKCDIWSLGCMLYEVCNLAPPFTASSYFELRMNITLGSFERLPAQYSSKLDNFIRKLIQIKASSRPSAEEILKELQNNPVSDVSLYGELIGQMEPFCSQEQELEINPEDLVAENNEVINILERPINVNRYQRPDSTSVRQASPVTSYSPCAVDDVNSHEVCSDGVSTLQVSPTLNEEPRPYGDILARNQARSEELEPTILTQMDPPQIKKRKIHIEADEMEKKTTE